MEQALPVARSATYASGQMSQTFKTESELKLEGEESAAQGIGVSPSAYTKFIQLVHKQSDEATKTAERSCRLAELSQMEREYQERKKNKESLLLNIDQINREQREIMAVAKSPKGEGTGPNDVVGGQPSRLDTRIQGSLESELNVTHSARNEIDRVDLLNEGALFKANGGSYRETNSASRALNSSTNYGGTALGGPSGNSSYLRASAQLPPRNTYNDENRADSVGAQSNTWRPKYTKDYKAQNFTLTTNDPNNLMQIIREYETIISNKDHNLYEIRQQLRTLELDQTQVLITLRQKLEGQRKDERDQWAQQLAQLNQEHTQVLNEKEQTISGLKKEVKQAENRGNEKLIEQQKLIQGIHQNTMQQMKSKHQQEMKLISDEKEKVEKQLKEMENKYHVLRCSEILQKFQEDATLKELKELGDLTDTLEVLDQKYQKRSIELVNCKAINGKLNEEYAELKKHFTQLEESSKKTIFDLKQNQEEQARLRESFTESEQRYNKLKPECDLLVQKAENEKQMLIQEKIKLQEEKQRVENAKDQALQMANDLIDRLKTQLVKVEETLTVQLEDNKMLKKSHEDALEQIDKLKKSVEEKDADLKQKVQFIQEQVDIISDLKAELDNSDKRWEDQDTKLMNLKKQLESRGEQIRRTTENLVEERSKYSQRTARNCYDASLSDNSRMAGGIPEAVSGGQFDYYPSKIGDQQINNNGESQTIAASQSDQRHEGNFRDSKDKPQKTLTKNAESISFQRIQSSQGGYNIAMQEQSTPQNVNQEFYEPEQQQRPIKLISRIQSMNSQQLNEKMQYAPYMEYPSSIKAIHPSHLSIQMQGSARQIQQVPNQYDREVHVSQNHEQQFTPNNQTLTLNRNTQLQKINRERPKKVQEGTFGSYSDKYAPVYAQSNEIYAHQRINESQMPDQQYQNAQINKPDQSANCKNKNLDNSEYKHVVVQPMTSEEIKNSIVRSKQLDMMQASSIPPVNSDEYFYSHIQTMSANSRPPVDFYPQEFRHNQNQQIGYDGDNKQTNEIQFGNNQAQIPYRYLNKHERDDSSGARSEGMLLNDPSRKRSRENSYSNAGARYGNQNMGSLEVVAATDAKGMTTRESTNMFGMFVQSQHTTQVAHTTQAPQSIQPVQQPQPTDPLTCTAHPPAAPFLNHQQKPQNPSSYHQQSNAHPWAQNSDYSASVLTGPTDFRYERPNTNSTSMTPIEKTMIQSMIKNMKSNIQ